MVGFNWTRLGNTKIKKGFLIGCVESKRGELDYKWVRLGNGLGYKSGSGQLDGFKKKKMRMGLDKASGLPLEIGSMEANENAVV